jgi:hypothetical protein
MNNTLPTEGNKSENKGSELCSYNNFGNENGCVVNKMGL